MLPGCKTSVTSSCEVETFVPQEDWMHVVHACPLGCSHPSLINDEDHLRLGRLILDFELDVVVIEIGFLRKFLDPLGGSGVNLSLLRIGTQRGTSQRQRHAAVLVRLARHFQTRAFVHLFQQLGAELLGCLRAPRRGR